MFTWKSDWESSLANASLMDICLFGRAQGRTVVFAASGSSVPVVWVGFTMKCTRLRWFHKVDVPPVKAKTLFGHLLHTADFLSSFSSFNLKCFHMSDLILEGALLQVELEGPEDPEAPKFGSDSGSDIVKSVSSSMFSVLFTSSLSFPIVSEERSSSKRNLLISREFQTASGTGPFRKKDYHQNATA